ncbi:hypothetical protein DRQ18_02520 [bacterium]|nr:MAG: hypothetical protein DRQ18_02520 [bacterium]
MSTSVEFVRPHENIFEKLESLDLSFRDAVVFPNERSRFYFREFYLKKKEGVLPSLFTMEEFLSFLSGKVPTDQENSLGILMDIHPSGSFSISLAYAEKLLEFFNEIDAGMVGWDEIEWVAEYEPWKRFMDEVRKIYEEYKNRMREKEWVDKGDVYREAIKGVEKARRHFERIIFVNPLALTTAERRIIRSVPSIILLQTLVSEEDRIPGRPFHHHHRLLKYLGKEIPSFEFEARAAIEVYEGEDRHGLLSMMEHALLCAMDADIPPEKVGIILPDPSYARVISERIMERYGIKCNLTMGLPFMETPLYSFLDTIFTLVETEKDGKLRKDDLLELFSHPYFYARKDLKDRIEKVKKNLEETYIPPDAIGDSILQSEVVSVLDCVRKKRTLRELYDGLLSLITVLERELEIPPGYPHADGFNVLTRHLVRVKDTELGRFSVEQEKSFEFLREILSGLRIHKFGEPFKGVQIMGVLESRLIPFEVVVVPLMNEGYFPSPRKKELFLPDDARGRINERAGEDKLELQRHRDSTFSYFFHVWLSGAKKLYLGYVKEEKKSTPSRFVEQVTLGLYGEEVKPVKVGYEGGEIKKRERFFERRIINPDEFEFSPTRIDLYFQCPYRFYLEYVLGIREEKEEEELEGKGLGKLVHETLQRFYSEIREGPPEDGKRLFEIFEELFRRDYPVPSGRTLLRKELVKERLRMFVEEEKKRKPFKVLMLERSITTQTGRFRIKGVVDRVDEEDGRFVVIDYKTGYQVKTPLSFTPDDREDLRNGKRSVQLDTYLYLLSKRGEVDPDRTEVRFYSFRENKYLEKRFTKYGSKREVELFEGFLISVLEEIVDENNPFEPNYESNLCDSCPYAALCRRWEYV